MDATNYYEYMKKFEVLRKQKEELIHRKEQQKLKARVQLLQTLKNSLNHDIDEIKRTSDGINGNNERLSSVLARKSQEFVHMDKSCVHNVQNIVESIRGIFESAKETCDKEMSAYDGKMLEFVKDASKMKHGSRKIHHNCYTLFNNVHYLKSGEMEKDDSLNATIDSKGRLRSSVLSDSSFLNTFQSNNVSASSPIPFKVVIHGCDSDKEN